MIPKIIHMCWLSGDPFPPEIQKCIDTWKIHLSDYEIWLWGKKPQDAKSMQGLNVKEKHFDINSTVWTKQAYEAKKFAFAADYIRLYALYNFGGIYLDSDIIVYKNFDNLLNLPYFIGQEYTLTFEPAAFGAQKGVKWIADVFERYNNRSFLKEDGTMDMLALPDVFDERLCRKYKLFRLHEYRFYSEIDGQINVFDQDFFNSRNSIEPHHTVKSYCSHAYAGSWKKTPFVKRLKQNPYTKWLVKIWFDISHKTYKRKEIFGYALKFINE